jgi:hypothetical protein
MKPSVSITVTVPGEEALYLSGPLGLLRELIRAFERESGDVGPAREAALPAMLAAEAPKLKSECPHA